ncbi:Hyaluronidase-1 [Varanus komodoensis]|uniref:Hyaluronidase n=1 Tax=Varanus komodoensis TaxID=61221 RepID=A0A8D2Q5J9_VARKO|nr:hyaluronidase-1 [Varanus komodoensis]KAF7249757.1 Hyaluronidase-1 [Varanus komodoensis]
MLILTYMTIWTCLLNGFTMTWYHRMAGGDPVISDRPFVAIWNAPSEECEEKYNVSLDLETFYVISNQKETFMGKDITLFYGNRLGYYPHYTEDGTAVHGGIPQNASLKEHLWKAQQDIEISIWEKDFKGLAIVDWESWRPLWVRNWGSMEIYQNKSLELVKEQHPDWPADMVAMEAHLEFERSSREFMEKTLALGKGLRPKGFWGFYGFPACYNYNYNLANYTGDCPEIEKQRNEELQWLWNQSTAFYPSIYLPQKVRFFNRTLEFVRHRLQEAFRMVNRTGTGSTPVLPYTSMVYEFTEDFLTQEDLVHTIGESASQGTAGVILWGSTNSSASQEACLHLKTYMDTLLGPYIVNVTSSSRLCSQIMCSMNGRCVRQESHREAFLHLSPDSFSIKRHPLKPHFTVRGQMSTEEQLKMAKEFMCQCYTGWEGFQCEKKSA